MSPRSTSDASTPSIASAAYDSPASATSLRCVISKSRDRTAELHALLAHRSPSAPSTRFAPASAPGGERQSARIEHVHRDRESLSDRAQAHDRPAPPGSHSAARPGSSRGCRACAPCPTTRKPGMSGVMMNAVSRGRLSHRALNGRLRECRDHAGAMPVADPDLSPVERPRRSVGAELGAAS